MNDNTLKAKQILERGSFTYILCRELKVYKGSEHGISPILDYIEMNTCLKGFSAADRVVGKAAAFLYVILGINEIFAPVMSGGAIRVLNKYNIKTYYNIFSGTITNRKGSGICPMEKSVFNIDDPETALKEIRKCRNELSRTSY